MLFIELYKGDYFSRELGFVCNMPERKHQPASVLTTLFSKPARGIVTAPRFPTALFHYEFVFDLFYSSLFIKHLHILLTNGNLALQKPMGGNKPLSLARQRQGRWNQECVNAS